MSFLREKLLLLKGQSVSRGKRKHFFFVSSITENARTYCSMKGHAIKGDKYDVGFKSQNGAFLQNGYFGMISPAH
jgi:hypothetical protein